eukprot:12799636-Heterocapsa_arctica.AAC.1
MIYNTVGGGTGSGLGCLMLECLSVDYGKMGGGTGSGMGCSSSCLACFLSLSLSFLLAAGPA